jgi:hypothetical protein
MTKKAAFPFDSFGNTPSDSVGWAILEAFEPLLAENPTKLAFTGEITEKDIDRLKADLKRMTKIYRSISNVDSFKYPDEYAYNLELAVEAHLLWRNFRKYLETWGYRTLLPKLRKNDTGLYEDEVRTALSDAIYKSDPGMMFRRYNTGDKSYNLPEIVSNRDRIIKSYQLAFGKLFDVVHAYIESKSGAIERRAPKETYQVAGMTVVVNTHGLTDQAVLDEFLHKLPSLVQPIKQAGFEGAIKGMTLNLDFSRSDLRAGQYDSGSDELTLFPLGMTDNKGDNTFIHEVGHRFYYRNLPTNARAYWESMIEGRTVLIESADVKAFVAECVKGKQRLLSRELEAQIKQAGYDPVVEAKFLHLADHVPGYTDDLEKIEQIMLKDRIGERVQLEAVSEYGNTNPSEAFAEAFMLWIELGPRALGPWTRQFFQTISRSGGANLKMAHRVLTRYLKA